MIKTIKVVFTVIQFLLVLSMILNEKKNKGSIGYFALIYELLITVVMWL